MSRRGFRVDPSTRRRGRRDPLLGAGWARLRRNAVEDAIGYGKCRQCNIDYLREYNARRRAERRAQWIARGFAA